MIFRDVRIEKKGDNLFEATAVLSFYDEGKCNKTLVGKITRSVNLLNTNDCVWEQRVRELQDEARRAALSAFFKEVYGYVDTSDIAVDEFGRPLNDKTGESFSDCSTIDLTTET